MKTLEDYIKDPAVVYLQMPLREVKAIRLMIYDKTKDMTKEELTEHYKQLEARIKEQYPEIKFVSSARID